MTLESRRVSGGYNKQLIIQGIDLALHSGEWLSCIGPNGSGKSTFLRLISRLLPPRSGVTLLDGTDIQTLSPQAVARVLAVLPQQQRIPQGITVWQLVSLGRAPYQSWWQWEGTQTDRDIVSNVISQVQLEGMAHRPVEQLSGGERQRAFLALALAQSPQVLILDEPTTYLDIRYQLELLELLKRLNQEQQLSVITVLHDLNLAARYSHRVALIHRGQLWSLGSPEAVLTPDNLQAVFGIQVELLETSVGLQVCPIKPTSITEPVSSTLFDQNHHLLM